MENSYIENSENCAAKEPFALRVQDSSMEPEFENGCIIIIDPSISPKTGDFVLFEKKDTIKDLKSYRYQLLHLNWMSSYY